MFCWRLHLHVQSTNMKYLFIQFQTQTHNIPICQCRFVDIRKMAPNVFNTQIQLSNMKSTQFHFILMQRHLNIDVIYNIVFLDVRMNPWIWKYKMHLYWKLRHWLLAQSVTSNGPANESYVIKITKTIRILCCVDFYLTL